MNLYHKLMDEWEEGADGSTAANENESATQAEETPSYLFGDVTADEASERFSYLRELPDHLRGLESRMTESVNPVMETLKGVQERLGSQPVFDPKLEKVKQVLSDYDPKLAETLLPALMEDLKGSMTTTPLGPEALEPHVSPMLDQMRSAMIQEMVPTLLESLPFDANGIVNRDPTNNDNVLAPQTDLQKDFATWWEQSDAPTRRALSNIGMPYVQALQKFGKWRAERLRGKGKAAGDASARLSSAARASAGGGRQESSRQLRTEEDGFNSVFAKRS